MRTKDHLESRRREPRNAVAETSQAIALRERKTKPDAATASIVPSLLRRIHRGERGSQLVEFGISIIVLLMMVFGIFDFARAMYCYHFVSYAAQDASRFAIVRGADWSAACSTAASPNFAMKFGCMASGTDVQNYVRNNVTPFIDASQVKVTTTWPGTTPNCTKNCSVCSPANSRGCQVQVQVSYKFQFMLPFLPRSSGLNFSGTAQKVIQQ